MVSVARLALACLSLVGVAGCVAPGPSASAANSLAYDLSPDERQAIEAGVRSRLKDPASANFGQFVTATKHSNGDIYACGTVNAKNSFGGYVGESPYLAQMRNGAVIDATTASGSDGSIVLMMCRRYGVAV